METSGKREGDIAEEQIRQNGSYDLGIKENWKDIFQYVMDMQFNLSNVQGYLEFKRFYDLLD